MILVTGGYTGSERLSSTEVLQGGVWREAGALPSARGNLRCVSSGGTLYTTGGWDGDSRLTDILAWQPESQTWRHVGDMATARNYHAVTSVPDSFTQLFCQ